MSCWNEVLVLIPWAGSSLSKAVSPLPQRKEGQCLQGSAWSGTTWGATPMAMSKYARLWNLPLAAFVWKFQHMLARMVVFLDTCWLSLSWELPRNWYFSKHTWFGIRTMTSLQGHLPFTLNVKSLKRPDEFFLQFLESLVQWILKDLYFMAFASQVSWALYLPFLYALSCYIWEI